MKVDHTRNLPWVGVCEKPSVRTPIGVSIHEMGIVMSCKERRNKRKRELGFSQCN